MQERARPWWREVKRFPHIVAGIRLPQREGLGRSKGCGALALVRTRGREDQGAGLGRPLWRIGMLDGGAASKGAKEGASSQRESDQETVAQEGYAGGPGPPCRESLEEGQTRAGVWWSQRQPTHMPKEG